MALDLFVMPLHRYLQGHFETGTERFARESGVAYHRSGAKPCVSEVDAKQFVQSLRHELMQALGPEIRWRDEGDIAHSTQLNLDCWHALRALAADQHHPSPGFVFNSESHEHPALAAIYNGAWSGYVHLIRHNDANGFYLPCDFDEPFRQSLLNGEPVTPLVGSSTRLLKELNLLGQRMRMARDEGEEGWTEQFQRDDPLELVKSGWIRLRHAVRMSVSRRLPLIFDG